MDLIKIGNFLVYLRKEKKLTQLQLAEELDVSDKTVSKWERGICLPVASTVERIINFFDITLMEFYAGERNKKLTDKDVNETAKKVLEISLENKTKKFKKFIVSLIAIFILIVFVITVLFMYNTYNKYHVYNITSSNEQFVGNGNIILAGEKSIITLMDLDIIEKEISQKMGYLFEYSLMLDELLIYQYGDIYLYNNDKKNSICLGEFINDISVYLNYDFSEITPQDLAKSKKLSLKIKYINIDSKIEEYSMDFEIVKSISNNKIVM